MKAPPFQYALAQSRQQALELLSQHGTDARILAGGQSLMPMLNMRLAAPAVLVDINPIHDLSGITKSGSMVTIGATTRHHEVATSAVIQRDLPLISEAMSHVAHVAIRNRGTFGGSLAMADPAAEMPACCLALGARMVIENARGRRTVSADDFFIGIFETALQPDELLVAVEFDVPEQPWRHSFLEFARRQGDYAIVGGVLRLRIEARRIADIRLIMFGVGERPLRLRKAENTLMTSARIEDGIAAATSALHEELPAFDDTHATVEMRHHLARVLLRRLVLPFRPELD